jgi:molybdopterin molybdotransferase
MEKDFFKVQDLETVWDLIRAFPPVAAETQPLDRCVNRVLAGDVVSEIDLPEFTRATMDGFAVRARSTFGASENTPALFDVVGRVEMGQVAAVSVKAGEAVEITTGGMLPEGADAVVMVEHTQRLDDRTIEVFKSVTPLQHVMEIGEDLKKKETVLRKGTRIRPQEIGLLAALGKSELSVYRRPIVAVISSGDEIVPIDREPALSEIRDVNSYTLSALIALTGAEAVSLGIAGDRPEELDRLCRKALARADMVLISGGSSVGTRDYTLKVFQGLPDARILVHGVSVSPGKPTLLAESRGGILWGLPGQVTSAMIVFHTMVRPSIHTIAGQVGHGAQAIEIPAVLSRNLASRQGRTDFVRVRLMHREGTLIAEPILGKSGLIHTMVKADGLVCIPRDSEGLDKGHTVKVIPFQ